MSKQIFVGLMTEGETDNRFLESVVKRTFEEIGFECNGEVEIYVRYISVEKSGLSFIDHLLVSSRQGIEDFGIMILCVHTDADNQTDKIAFQNKIIPAINRINQEYIDNYCKTIVPIVPVQMIEAWMLADRDLLRNEIGTDKSDNELGFNRFPERIADPKSLIESAIRIARASLTKRRRKDLTISELYLPIGQKVEIRKLDTLPSFIKFKEAIRIAFQKLNYMQ